MLQTSSLLLLYYCELHGRNIGAKVKIPKSEKRQTQTSFPVIHKVGNVGQFCVWLNLKI